jgi:hypothetical protein
MSDLDGLFDSSFKEELLCMQTDIWAEWPQSS